jgi:hypothetical protein
MVLQWLTRLLESCVETPFAWERHYSWRPLSSRLFLPSVRGIQFPGRKSCESSPIYLCQVLPFVSTIKAWILPMGYFAHMNADQLVVFDTKKRAVLANLVGFAVVDQANLKTVATISEIKYPDGLAYAPTVQRVFVSDEYGNAEAVIDGTNNTLVTSIPLGGGAGNTVYDGD